MGLEKPGYPNAVIAMIEKKIMEGKTAGFQCPRCRDDTLQYIVEHVMIGHVLKLECALCKHRWLVETS